MPCIVFIIPTKDRRPLLARAVDSVRAQGGMWRAIIVDDGSTDDTPVFLKTLSGDSRFNVIRNATNRGVNIARNVALKRLMPGEWGFLLDDDDLVLPGAVETMAKKISQLPPEVLYTLFNTRIRTATGEYDGGYQFSAGSEAYHDLSYREVILKAGFRGDAKPALSSELVRHGYLFAEDVNGFESEFNARLARDGRGIRCFPDQVAYIDQAHGEERLSDTAAVRDPASFVRVHIRMLRDHAAFLTSHPVLLRQRSLSGLRVALRARDFRALSIFAGYWLKSFLLRVRE